MTRRYSNEVLGVGESLLIRIGALADAMPDSIKLCWGESDLPTPEFIARACTDAMAAGHTYYTTTAGYPALREAIARKVHALHGVEYRPSEIMSTVGASMGVFTAIRACVGPGDNAVVITPTYAIFTNAVVLSGGEPRAVPLVRQGEGYQLDLDRVRDAIDGRTRMLIVNSPSNPTGWVISPSEQRALYELAIEHDLVILADEVYERLVYDTPLAPSFATVARDSGDTDRLVVANSFSKTYNMTGWRLGWVQASERMIALMSSAAEFMTSNAAAMVQQAGIVALRDGDAYVGELRRHYADRRAQVMRALAEMPGVSVSEPKGAFFAFPRVDGVTDSLAFALDLLQETGVALTPGAAFGEAGEGHIRICFAASEQTLGEGLARMKPYFDRLSSRA